MATKEYAEIVKTTAVPHTTTRSSYAPIYPARPISMRVELGLTVTYTTLYSFLFLIIYIQLCMILYYKHKRFSYQSSFLFLCLFWAALRTVLFSFYFNNTVQANDLSALFYWLLYSFPLCLQFVILCLLVLYFSQLYFKIIYRSEPHRHRPLIRLLVLIAVLIFCSTNVVCSILLHKRKQTYSQVVSTLVFIRVVICQLLFMTGIVVLSIFIVKISRCSQSKLVLEAKGMTVCQSVSACSCLVLLYLSRAAYSLVVLIMRSCNCKAARSAPTFNFSWINISDQADIANVKGSLYVTFGIVLFLWEFLPTFIVVMLYRVQRPQSTPVNLLETSTQSFSSKVYFFDNPRRYDSDEDLNPSINNPSSHGTDVMRSSSSHGLASSSRSIYGRHAPYSTHGSISPSHFFPSSPINNNSIQSHSVPASMSKLLINPVQALTENT